MKTVNEIYQDMKALYLEKTGTTVHDKSDMGVRMYASAVEIGSLYAYNDWVKRQTFPQTAEGEALDNHAELRGIYRDMGAKARGDITFYASNVAATNRTVPAGTVCQTQNGVLFTLLSDAVLLPGNLSVAGECECNETGLIGNALAGTVTYFVTPPVGISRCENLAAFSGGREAENDESLRQRVINSYRLPINGTNDAYYEMIAKAHEGVAAVKVLPKNRGVGTVDLIITAEGGMPSAGLIAAVQADINEKRELCVSSIVSAPTAVTQIIRIGAEPKSGYTMQDITAKITATLTGHFDGYQLGKSILLAEILNLVFNTEGVKNCEISYPLSDVEISASQLPVLQGVIVTEMGD